MSGAKKGGHQTLYIFLGMAVGLLIGAISPAHGVMLEPIGQIFLRLIKCIIVPLIFSTMVVGVAGHGSLKAVGRVGLKAIVYFELITTLALILGLVFANVCRPGVGESLAGANESAVQAKAHSFRDTLINIVPQSVVQAAADNEVLPVVVFALLFAAATTQAKHRQVILDFCEALSEVMFKFTALVMKAAPIGVGAALAATVGRQGLGVLVNLIELILTFYACALALVGFVFVPVLILCRIPARRFWHAIKEPALLAFSTSCSEAALPKAMQNLAKLGVPRDIISFVIPLGYSFNLDGTSLYLSLASLFIAQAAGVEMSLGQQVMMVFTLMITSKGVAGVPRVSLVIIAGTLASFHLPLAGVAVILGVDTIMDMGRSAINVMGNCLATTVMARWEGRLELEKDGA